MQGTPIPNTSRLAVPNMSSSVRSAVSIDDSIATDGRSITSSSNSTRHFTVSHIIHLQARLMVGLDALGTIWCDSYSLVTAEDDLRDTTLIAKPDSTRDDDDDEAQIARYYEQQLITLSQMHSDVLELNGRLQVN